MLSSPIFFQLNTQLGFSKEVLKITIKYILKSLLHVSVINHHQGACCMCFAKVIIVKQSVKIRRYGINSAAWLHIYSLLVGVCTVDCAE